MVNQKDYISVFESLPLWERGVVQVKNKDGKNFKARFNEMGMWWRVYTKKGVERIDDEDGVITYWRDIK